MKMWAAYGVLLCLGWLSALRAQDFQNLDFESANVSNLLPNTAEFVSVADGLPGWSAYIGTNQLTQVGHNAITLGAANVGVLGPEYPFDTYPLQGAYTAIVQPGAFGGQGLPASIAQAGLIPASAKSMRFLAFLGFTNDLVVTIGGQTTPVVPLGSGSFGCDVSAFAGSVEDLKFTILDTHGNDENLLDAITFSMESVPEPSGISLVIVASAALGAWRLTCRRPA